MIIGIDPGHGGSDPGAIGPGGLQEKTVNLLIASHLAQLLNDRGIQVITTRKDDRTVTLAERSSRLNAAGVDYVIAIHCNASSSQAPDYISTYIQARGGQAEKLAQAVQAELVAATGWVNGGVRTANLHMTRETKAPAILVECGFISNPDQERDLVSPVMQRDIARAIYTGLLKHLDLPAVPEPAPANPEQWKYDIIGMAKTMGIINQDHDPNEAAPKWFVLTVIMAALAKIKKEEI